MRKTSNTLNVGIEMLTPNEPVTENVTGKNLPMIEQSIPITEYINENIIPIKKERRRKTNISGEQVAGRKESTIGSEGERVAPARKSRARKTAVAESLVEPTVPVKKGRTRKTNAQKLAEPKEPIIGDLKSDVLPMKKTRGRKTSSAVALEAEAVSEIVIKNADLISKSLAEPTAQVTIASSQAVDSNTDESRNVTIPRNRITKKKWITLALRATLTLVLFYFLLKSFSWSAFFKTLLYAHHSLVLVGLIVGAFGLVLSCFQWQSLLRAEKIHAELGALIKLYLVGIAFNHFLPTSMGGDTIKAFYVGRESKNNPGSASAAVMSRVTGFIGMTLVAVPVVILWHNRFHKDLVVWFVVLTAAVAVLLVGAFVAVRFLPLLLRGKWASHRIFVSVMRVGNALTLALMRPRFICEAIFFGMQFWVSVFLGYYTYATALGLHVPFYFYFIAIPIGSLVAFLPISINGYGLRESVFVYTFSTVHVPVSTSLLLALLMDAQVLFFGIIGGYIYLTMGKSMQVINRNHNL